MAHHAEDDFDGDIFIYRGGRAPQHITHVLIDESVDEIEDKAFENCRRLVQVDTHNSLRRIGKWAFRNCTSLRRINLKFVVDIDDQAFHACADLESVEFGDKLETIGNNVFECCTSLTHLKLPCIITIGTAAFGYCTSLIDVELPMGLESMGPIAFWGCERLQRIAVPPKRGLFAFDDDVQKYNQFDDCQELVTVDLVGEIHKTVASLHMDSWRTEMIAEINRINQVLPNTRLDKAEEIQQWMDVIIDKMDHYKAEHYGHVQEGITLLELALWKAKLGEKEDSSVEGPTKKAKVDSESVRKERRITCGADTVIKNVLPFLELK